VQHSSHVFGALLEHIERYHAYLGVVEVGLGDDGGLGGGNEVGDLVGEGALGDDGLELIDLDNIQAYQITICELIPSKIISYIITVVVRRIFKF